MRFALLAAIILPALTLACCSETLRAQPQPAPHQPAPESQPNAADAYRRIWAKLPADLAAAALDVTVSPAGAELSKETTAHSLDDAFTALKTHQDTIADLMKAAAMPRCDFGFTVASSNQATQLSRPMRDTARILRADAARLWTQGQTDEAVGRLVALYGFGAQLGHESILLTAMVDDAIILLANDTSRTMASSAGKPLNRAQRDKLLAAINRLDPKDPAGLLRGTTTENKTIAADPHLRSTLQASQAKLLRDIRQTRQVLENK